MLNTRIHQKSYLFSFFLFLFCLSLSAQNSFPKELELWLDESRKDWKIPGMAVGIVKEGKVIYAGGFGEKQLDGGELVDSHTVFSIASVSKNMTAAALAILVDEGKISWDDKIIDHLPWFQFKDPWVSREATIRDALTHRIGLGRILGNRLQFMTKSSRDELLYRVRYMEFEAPFRSGFVYNNLMYSLAGQIIEYVDGRSWDDFLKEELFGPLGMQRASTRLSELERQENIAYPHQEIEGKVVLIPRRNWDNAGPAGGVNASVRDLNQWMLMQLGTPGVYDEKEFISREQMNEMHKPQNIRMQSHANSLPVSYGLGWIIQYYKGQRILTHGGATDGFNTFMYLIPEMDLGIVILTNNFNQIGSAVINQLIDYYLNDSQRDWNAYYLSNYEKRYAEVQALRDSIHNARIKDSQPSLSKEKYVGVYKSDAYGEVEVFLKGQDLHLRFWNDTDLEAVLEHWHFDTYRAVWKNKALREEFMQFHLNKRGEVEALDFEFVLRPMLLQVGAYPSNYTHTERFEKE